MVELYTPVTWTSTNVAYQPSVQPTSNIYVPSVITPSYRQQYIQQNYPTLLELGYQQTAGVQISEPSVAFYSGASGVAETIRRGIPEVSSRVSAVPVVGAPIAFVTSRTSESTARLIETGGMVPGGVEVLARRPEVFPAAVQYGVSETVRSIGEEWERDPSQVISDIGTSALLFKGAGRIPVRRMFTPIKIKSFFASERAEILPRRPIPRVFGEGYGLKRLPEIKQLSKVKVAVMEREPVVLPSLKGLTVAKPTTATEIKVFAKPKTIEEVRVWTRTKPDILTATRTKTRTMVVPVTAFRIKVQPTTRVFQKVRARVSTKPLTIAQTATQTATRTRLKVRPITTTAIQTQTRLAILPKVQPLTKVKTLTQTKTLTRTSLAIKPITSLRVKIKKPRTGKTPLDSYFKRGGSLGFGKFGEIARIRSAKEMLRGI